MSGEKCGSFDWLVESREFARFLGPKFTGVIGPKRCLVIGCGTSKLSEDLHALEFGEIVSIDNDKGCIELMKGLYKTIPALKWIVADLITGTGVTANKKVLDDEGFDLIIDKGTFDAILVEGTVSPMLANVHRMLKPDGAYVICSLNSEHLLGRLLLPTLIGWKTSFFSANERTRIVVCNKRPIEAIDWGLVAEEETKALDEHFKKDKPLLTPEVESGIRAAFSAPLEFKAAHSAIFDALLPSLGYEYDLFLQDLKGFAVATKGKLTADEAVSFIVTMQ